MRLPVLASLLALAAAPALGQGQVNVYNWSDYIAETELKNFEKNTGIKVNYTTYDSNEILDAKLKTGRSGYDVVVPTASPFFVRQLAAGLFLPIDKAKLKNFGNLVPEINKRLPGAPVDSLKMVFDPEVVAKFKDCGVMMLDSATDVLPAALNYLGRDPDSKKPEDLAKAADVVKAVRPYIRKFHSSEYINALAGGNICLVFGYSGDILQARDRAAKASDRQDIAYAIPKEGSLLWIDVAAIPKDAPDPNQALRFLDFMMEPKVAAASSELTGYANANKAATALLPKDISGNPLIYPPAAVRARFYTITAGNAEQVRERTRLWTTIKTGR